MEPGDDTQRTGAMRAVGAGPSRLRSLDGLRGVAAVIVLLHHAALLNASVSNVYLNPAAPLSPTAIVLTRTPLQLLTSGEEAVLVFFVLSGLVVALPAIRGPFDWLAYYPRRVLRIVLPVVASVVLAAVLVLASLHPASQATSSWSGNYSFDSLDWRQVVRTADLLLGDVAINNPLWSLRYEILFSILLPLYIVMARAWSRRVWIPIVGVVVVMIVGYLVQDPNLQYLPIFLLGTVLAVRLDDVRIAVARWTAGRRAWIGVATTIIALLAIDARWILRPIRPTSATLGEVGFVVSVFGAAALVVVVASWGPAVRVFETRLVQWLGRISFSLYLVHAPILLAASTWLHGLPWWAGGLLGIPIAVIVAALFCRFVEQPAHRLARSVGRRLVQRDVGSPPQ